jgi:hypothetical protein
MASRFYHGGAPRLRVGEEILPGSAIGRENLYSDSDSVWITDDRMLARHFAIINENRAGCIYEVAPVGRPERTPPQMCRSWELAREFSHEWRCESAVVKKVIGQPWHASRRQWFSVHRNSETLWRAEAAESAQAGWVRLDKRLDRLLAGASEPDVTDDCRECKQLARREADAPQERTQILKR